MSDLKAFHNDPAIKTKYIARVNAHIKADNLIRGIGWENGRGCAVGCTLESYNHAAYENELGIPEWLARLEDTLFEGMSKEKSKAWPKVFLQSINIGADLEKAKNPFLIFILENCIKSMDACVYDKKKNPDVAKSVEGSKKAVLEMIRCKREGLDEEAARSARGAYTAAWAANVTAWAARSAREFRAAYAADRAARSAEAALCAARGAPDRAAAEAARGPQHRAPRAAYDLYADKLIEIISEIKCA